MLSEFSIIIDTREQKPWTFTEEEKKPGKCRVNSVITSKLDTGDYSIVGLEDKLCIERKNGFAELFGNMTPKANKDRFEREMERMRGISHKYIIIDTSLSHDLLSLGVPQAFKGPPAKTVLDWLLYLQIEYGVNVIFAGECGKRVARSIMEQIARKYLN